MLQNMLITALTPLSSKCEVNSWENRRFLTVWPERAREQIQDASINIKKRKRVRTAFSSEQIRTLEKTFSQSKYIDKDKRLELANTLSMDSKCIKIWFQNRRMKEKKQLSELNDVVTSSIADNHTTSVSASSPSPSQWEYYQSQSGRCQIQTGHCQRENSIQHFSCDKWSDCFRNKINCERKYLPPSPGHQNELSYQYNMHFNNVKDNYYGNNLDCQNNFGYTVFNNPREFYVDNNVYYTNYYPNDMNYTGNKQTEVKVDTHFEENSPITSMKSVHSSNDALNQAIMMTI